MILGHLKNYNQEIGVLAPALKKGVEFLSKTDLAALALGKHIIDGDNIFALVSEYETEPKSNKLPEAHKKYIDIQCLAIGEEIIGHSILASKYEVTKDDLASNDIVFYKAVENEVDVVLKPGMYMVLLPSDVHRPGCSVNGANKVKKIVVKIAVSLL